MVNNKKVKWKDQKKVPGFPMHLLPSPSEPASRYDSQIREVPTAVACELKAYVDRARVRGMQQIDDLVYYGSNSDDDNEDNGDTFHDSIQVEDMIDETYNDNDDVNGKPINDVIDDTDDNDNNVQRKPINNEFLQPIGQQEGATGIMYEHEGVLSTQYCHYGELYYQPYEIYGDDLNETEEAIDSMAHSSELWFLLPFKTILCYILSWNMINT